MRASLRLRLTLTYLSLAVAPILMVAALVGYRSVTELEAQSEALLRAVATQVNVELDGFIQSRFQELRAFELGSGLARLEQREQRAALAKLLAHNRLYQEVSLVSADGRTRVHLSRTEVTLPGDGSGRSLDDALRIPAERGLGYFGQVRFDEAVREPLATLASPVFDRRSGELAYVIVAELRLARIWEVLGRMALPHGVDVFVLEPSGRVVAHKNPATVLSDTRIDVPRGGETIQIRGRESLAVSSKIGRTSEGLVAVATRPTAIAFAPATRSLYITAAVSAAAILVAGLAIVLAVRQIVRPIEALAATARRVSAGDLDVEPVPGGEGEVRELGEAFEQMMRDLRRSMRETREAQQRLNRQQKLAAVGQMAGELGHELRNPLGVISNSVAMLETSVPESDRMGRRAVDRLSRQVEKISRLTRDLLSFARTRESQKAHVWIEELVDEIVLKFPPPAGVAVSKVLPRDPPAVHVDRHQVEQVLANIVMNAYEAMPEGGELTIRVVDGADVVTCELADTGDGIAPETLEKVFEPLFTTKREGVGLGLAICKDLTEANGGQLAVSSAQGAGTTFSVVLPRGESARSAEERAAG